MNLVTAHGPPRRVEPEKLELFLKIILATRTFKMEEKIKNEILKKIDVLKRQRDQALANLNYFTGQVDALEVLLNPVEVVPTEQNPAKSKK